MPLAANSEGLLSIVSNDHKKCYIVTQSLEVKATINVQACDLIIKQKFLSDRKIAFKDYQ